MNRAELVEALLVERYGPRPRRCEVRQEPAPVVVQHFTDTPAAQARRRAVLAGAADDHREIGAVA